VAAGTLLLRQSLPVGIAVAGASAVLERVARGARRRSADTNVLEAAESDDGTVAQAARAALVPARAAAQRRGFAPRSLGLPEIATLQTELAAVRAEAWRFTQGRALLDAVGRWWRWARLLLFPLLNLGFLALGGHVAYRVGRAYYEGIYLPLSYYLNAVALGALWAGLGTALVALTLRGAVRRARAQGVAHLGERLEQLTAEQLSTIDEAQAPLTQARTLFAERTRTV
jgi:hypothetical protein